MFCTVFLLILFESHLFGSAFNQSLFFLFSFFEIRQDFLSDTIEVEESPQSSHCEEVEESFLAFLTVLLGEIFFENRPAAARFTDVPRVVRSLATMIGSLCQYVLTIVKKTDVASKPSPILEDALFCLLRKVFRFWPSEVADIDLFLAPLTSIVTLNPDVCLIPS